MKKTYCNPSLKVVKIQPTQILAGSEKMQLGSKYTDQTVLSREARFSGFDEEEE